MAYLGSSCQSLDIKILLSCWSRSIVHRCSKNGETLQFYPLWLCCVTTVWHTLPMVRFPCMCILQLKWMLLNQCRRNNSFTKARCVLDTLQKHLGYFIVIGCLSCISVTNECYQNGFIETLLSCLQSLVSFLRRPIWAHSYYKPCWSKKHSPEMLICTLSERRYYLTKEGSISTTFCLNCKYSSNFTCYAHKGMQLRGPKYG